MFLSLAGDWFCGNTILLRKLVLVITCSQLELEINLPSLFFANFESPEQKKGDFTTSKNERGYFFPNFTTLNLRFLANHTLQKQPPEVFYEKRCS